MSFGQIIQCALCDWKKLTLPNLWSWSQIPCLYGFYIYMFAVFCQIVITDMLNFYFCSSYFVYTLKYLNFNFRYIIFFCPCDLVSQGYSFLPVQLLAVGMKEVTRTWKIVGGVTHANSYYKNGWIVMIAIGWARGNINSMCSCKYSVVGILQLLNNSLVTFMGTTYFNDKVFLEDGSLVSDG